MGLVLTKLCEGVEVLVATKLCEWVEVLNLEDGKCNMWKRNRKVNKEEE